MLHVTPVLLTPSTVAVNDCVCPAVIVTVAGLTRTVAVGGTSVISVEAAEPSLAVTVAVTVCRDVTTLGAVYVSRVSPVVSGPVAALIVAPGTAGLKLNVTAALGNP